MCPFELVATPADLAEVDVVGQLQQIGVGVVGDLGNVLRRERGAERQRRGGRDADRIARVISVVSYRPPELFIAWGLSRIFCTRQSVISETKSSLGLRQSISCTVLNSFSAFPALPNLPMMVPSSSIL